MQEQAMFGYHAVAGDHICGFNEQLLRTCFVLRMCTVVQNYYHQVGRHTMTEIMFCEFWIEVKMFRRASVVEVEREA